MADVLTTVLENHHFRQGRSGVLTYRATRTWQGNLSSLRGEKGQSSDADPHEEPDSDPMVHTSREAASFLVEGTACVRVRKEDI